MDSSRKAGDVNKVVPQTSEGATILSETQRARPESAATLLGTGISNKGLDLRKARPHPLDSDIMEEEDQNAPFMPKGDEYGDEDAEDVDAQVSDEDLASDNFLRDPFILK